MNDKYEVFKKAISTYGIDSQLDMVIEEMSELIKEICKKKRGKNNHNHIVEDIADVEIMLEQLKIMCDVNYRELNGVKHQKIDRLNERLNHE